MLDFEQTGSLGVSGQGSRACIWGKYGECGGMLLVSYSPVRRFRMSRRRRESAALSALGGCDQCPSTIVSPNPATSHQSE